MYGLASSGLVSSSCSDIEIGIDTAFSRVMRCEWMGHPCVPHQGHVLS